MDPLNNLITEYTKALQPFKAFGEVLPYQQFAAPMQAFAQTAAQQYKPWYEYFQAAPAKAQLRGQAAASNLGMTGFGKDLMQRQLREIYQPLETATQGIQDQFINQWINPLYNRRIGQYYQSPTTGFNFNQIR